MKNKIYLLLILIIFIQYSYLFSELPFYKNIELIDTHDTNELLSIFSNTDIYPVFSDDALLINIKILFETNDFDALINYYHNNIKSISNQNVLDLFYLYFGLTNYQLGNYDKAIDSLLNINNLTHLKNAYLAFIFFSINSKDNFLHYKNEFFSLEKNNQFILLYSLISYIDIIYTYNNTPHLIEKKYHEYKNFIILYEDIFIDSFKYYWSALVKQGKYHSIFNEIEQIDYHNNYINYYKGFLFLKNLDFIKSEKIFYTILNDENVDKALENLVFLRLGQLYILNDQFEKSINILNKIKTNNSQLTIEKNISLGYSHYKINNMKQAYEYFNTISLDNLNYYHKYFNDMVITAFNAEKYEEVIHLFNELNFLKKFDSFPKENIFYYISSLYSLNNYKKIVDIYNNYKNMDFNTESLIIIAQAQQKTNQNYEAIKTLLNAANTTKSTTLINLIYEKIGDIYLLLNDDITALKYYKLTNESISAALKKADIYLILKQYTLLLKLVDDYENISSDDDYISLQLYKYKCLMELNRITEANKVLVPVIEYHKSFEIFYNILKTYFNNNKLENFEIFLNTYNNIFINDIRYKDVLVLYTDLLVLNKLYQKALQVIENLKDYFDVIPIDILLKQNDCYRNLNKYSESNELLHKLLNASELNYIQKEKIYFRLALNFYYQDKYNDALDYLNLIKNSLQDFTSLLYGDIYTALGNFNIAYNYYISVINNYPESSIYIQTLYRISILSLRKQDYSSAKMYLLEIINNFKNSIYFNNSLFILAHYAYQNYNYNETINYLNRIHNIENTLFEKDYYYLISKSYVETGDYIKAIEINNILMEKVDNFFKNLLLFDNARYYSILNMPNKSNAVLNKLMDSQIKVNDDYYFWSAANYILLKDFDKAEVFLNKVSNKDNVEDYALLSYILDIFTNTDKVYYYLEDFENKELTYINKLRYIYVKISNQYYLNNIKETEKLINQLSNEDITGLFKNKTSFLRNKYAE